jgi:(2Fe-2S) ferredoxin
MAAGAEPVFAALEAEIKRRSVAWRVARTGCAGMCSMEPLVEVTLPGQPAVMFGDVTPEFARHLAAACAAGKPLPAEKRVPGIADLARIAGEPVGTEGGPRQYRIVMRNCGVINPEEIDEYLDRGGYKALARVLSTMTPEQVIEELKVSGLRGRGGAGFPAWLKWSLTRESAGEEHLIVCNGDEGDPGAYMDRSVLEGDPHAVLEGMIIGGYVIGAKSGFFYIRAEYPLAIQRIEKALRPARAAGTEPPYHFIEVMACPGGCVGGGGQPYGVTDNLRTKRAAGLYQDDQAGLWRCAHENPYIQKLYEDFLGEPLGEKSEELLHTSYHPRPTYRR